eukprot:6104376-Karenia_brevis.AAC.1
MSVALRGNLRRRHGSEPMRSLKEYGIILTVSLANGTSSFGIYGVGTFGGKTLVTAHCQICMHEVSILCI